MVLSCCVIGCSNRHTAGCGKSFFRFPTDVARRRRWIGAGAWIAALRRVEPNEKPWEAKQSPPCLLRSFSPGRPSPNPPYPDSAPSLRMGYTLSTSTSSQRPAAEHGAPSLERSHRRELFSAKRVAAMTKAGEERELQTGQLELNRR